MSGGWMGQGRAQRVLQLPQQSGTAELGFGAGHSCSCMTWGSKAPACSSALRHSEWGRGVA